MKVYEKIVIDILTGQVVEEESHEYDGPVALCKGDDAAPTEVQETALEKESSRIATEQWNDYKTRFVLTENKFIASLRIDQGDKDKVAGQIGAGIASSTGTNLEASKDSLTASGVNPNSGRATVGLGDVTTGAANRGGKAMARGSSAMDDIHYAGLQSAISLGRGQASKASLGISDIAGQQVENAISDTTNNFNQAMSKKGETQELIGGTIGMGTAAYLNK